MAYPTGNDVVNFLISAGVLSGTPADLTFYNAEVKSAIRAFEKESGWEPFLAGNADSVRRFARPPRGQMLLDLQGGLLSLTSLKGDGVPLLEGWGRDFVLMPRAKVVAGLPDGEPYTFVKFLIDPASFDEFEIEGRWGFTSVLDADNFSDVWLAIVKKAAIAMAEMVHGPGGELVRERQGDVDYSFDVEHLQIEIWKRDYERVVARYRRKVMV